MPKVIPSSHTPHDHTRVNDASRVLKRFYVFERQMMRAFAGGFIATSPVELKFFLAGEMALSSLVADSLRTRVLELRYPRRDVDKKWDVDMLHITGELMKAPDLRAFLTGVYASAYPAFLRDIDRYLARADALDDAPTVYRLRHIRADIEGRIALAHAQMEQHPPEGDDATAWQAYIAASLASIGGISGMDTRAEPPADNPFAQRPAFTVPHTITRDPRFRPARFHLPHENKYDKAGAEAWRRIETLDKRVAMQVWSAISHFNEIWAAEIPASILFELDNQPWEFYLDFARWAWDEARHSFMGYRALQGWGWDVPALIPYGDALYNALGHLPPAQRLALLHYYEEGLLRSGTKQTEIKILESAGDSGSTHDMDYDWADEAIHVGFGFKWLRHLLGDDLSGQAELTRLTDEARAVMAAYVAAHQADPEAALAPYFERLYPVIAAMTYDIDEDGLDIQWSPVVADEAVLEAL